MKNPKYTFCLCIYNTWLLLSTNVCWIHQCTTFNQQSISRQTQNTTNMYVRLSAAGRLNRVVVENSALIRRLSTILATELNGNHQSVKWVSLQATELNGIHTCINDGFQTLQSMRSERILATGNVRWIPDKHNTPIAAATSPALQGALSARCTQFLCTS